MSGIDVGSLEQVPLEYKENLINYLKAVQKWKRFAADSPYKEFLQHYIDLLETTTLAINVDHMTPDQLSAVYPYIISVADDQIDGGNDKYQNDWQESISADYSSFSAWYDERKTELSKTDFLLKTNIDEDIDIDSLLDIQRQQYASVLKKYIDNSNGATFEGNNSLKSSRKLYAERINYIVNARQRGNMQEGLAYKNYTNF